MNFREYENNRQDNKNCSLVRKNTYEATRGKSQASILALLILRLFKKNNINKIKGKKKNNQDFN